MLKYLLPKYLVSKYFLPKYFPLKSLPPKYLLQKYLLQKYLLPKYFPAYKSKVPSAPLKGRLMALATNIKLLGWEGLSEQTP